MTSIDAFLRFIGRASGWIAPVSTENSVMYVCGNPEMITKPSAADTKNRFPPVRR
jgi:hypothetical protein